MIAEGITPQWTAQIRADSLYKSKTTLEPDHELLQLMRDSGGFLVYVGFESITQEGLDSYNKKQKVEHITTSIKLLHDYGIRVHGMFVVGVGHRHPRDRAGHRRLRRRAQDRHASR